MVYQDDPGRQLFLGGPAIFEFYSKIAIIGSVTNSTSARCWQSRSNEPFSVLLMGKVDSILAKPRPNVP